MELIDFDFLVQADEVTLRMETAKKNLENAKLELEQAKQVYDDLFAQAEQHGFNKAKLKKLTDDRASALIEVFASEAKTKKPTKPKDPPKKRTEEKASDMNDTENAAITIESAPPIDTESPLNH